MFGHVFRSPLSNPYNFFQRIAIPTQRQSIRTIMESHHKRHHITQKRVSVKRSDKYQFNGRASYLYAIRKWKIQKYSSFANAAANRFQEDWERLF